MNRSVLAHLGFSLTRLCPHAQNCAIVTLDEFLHSRTREQRREFYAALGRHRVYVHAVSKLRERAGPDLARDIELHSGGLVPKWELRPDLWEPPPGTQRKKLNGISKSRTPKRKRAA